MHIYQAYLSLFFHSLTFPPQNPMFFLHNLIFIRQITD